LFCCLSNYTGYASLWWKDEGMGWTAQVQDIVNQSLGTGED